MAKQKKRPAARKGKSAARRKPTRGRATKRAVAQATAKKRLTTVKPKRAGAKKVERKKVRATKPKITPSVEAVAVNVIEGSSSQCRCTECCPRTAGGETGVRTTGIGGWIPCTSVGPKTGLEPLEASIKDRAAGCSKVPRRQDSRT